MGISSQLNVLNILDGTMDTPQLIFKQVFPYLQDGHYRNKVSELFGIKGKEKVVKKRTSKVTRKLEDIAGNVSAEVNDLISQIEQEEKASKKRTSKKNKLDALLAYQETPVYKSSSLFARVINGKNLAIVNGVVYDLVSSNSTNHDSRIQIGKRKFGVVSNGDGKTKDLEERFLTELGKKIRISALQQHLSKDKIIDLLKSEDAKLLAMAGRKEYQGEGFGFTQDGAGDYYAYIEVPAFAIKSQFDGNYYFFDKTRVATRVSKSEKSLSYDGSNGNESGLVLIDNNNHPFLHNQRGSFAELCIGDLSFPTSGKDGGEVIAKRLRRCREMLMFGYTSHDYNSGYRLTDNGYFDKNRTTLSKLQRLKVPIIQGGSRR